MIPKKKMDNLQCDRPWIQINHWIPFRICYLYFDTKKFLGNNEFKHKKIKIRKITHFSYFGFNYVGVIITGWSKDKHKIEETLDIINTKIVLNPFNKDYLEFLKLWRNNLL